MRVGVLVSGRGSNLAALLADAAHPDAPYGIAVVVSNRAGAPAVARAEAAGVPAFVVERATFESRNAHQTAIADLLRQHAVELVVLAGFDQILGPDVVDAFPGRIVNVHPSLLPAFAGTLNAQRLALDHGVKVSGCTVHVVTHDVDGGPIIAQAAVPVCEHDTEETLAGRILAEEHRLLPYAVRLIAAGRVRLAGRRAVIVS